MGESAGVDGRRARGDRTRAAATRRAVDLASVDGLGGLSIAKLAEEIQLSKSGVATLFRTKEQLQLATIEAAGRIFTAEVVRPSMKADRGAARFGELIERWLKYAVEPLFPGGCFWVENLAAFDAHPGPVRDALAAQHRSWLGLLSGELREAALQGEVGDLDAELAAFEIQAVLAACSIALRLGDEDAPDKVRRIVADVLGRGSR